MSFDGAADALMSGKILSGGFYEEPRQSEVTPSEGKAVDPVVLSIAHQGLEIRSN